MGNLPAAPHAPRSPNGSRCCPIQTMTEQHSMKSILLFVRFWNAPVLGRFGISEGPTHSTPLRRTGTMLPDAIVLKLAALRVPGCVGRTIFLLLRPERSPP